MMTKEEYIKAWQKSKVSGSYKDYVTFQIGLGHEEAIEMNKAHDHDNGYEVEQNVHEQMNEALAWPDLSQPLHWSKEELAWKKSKTSDLGTEVIEKEHGISNDSQARKDAPVFSGFCAYFPNAMFEVARSSKIGNDKHNPGEPLHWSKEKSSDHGDCIIRHQLEFDQVDPSTGLYHAVAVAWRAMAQLEILLTK